MMAAAAGASPSIFDRYIVEYESRARVNSDNIPAAARSPSLPPPPRARKLSSPQAIVSTTSSKSPRPETPAQQSIMVQQQQQPPILRDPFNPLVPADISPLQTETPASVRIDTDDDDGPERHVYSNSFSSTSSSAYKDLFYKAPDVPISAVTRQTDEQQRTRQSLDFPDSVSVEDYSDLLYPELPSPYGTTRSLGRSSVIYAPPSRKRIPSFASSHNGPESPVEFSHLHAPSSPHSRPVSEERRPSKIDRLLGLESRSSSRKGSTDRLISAGEARRDSFIEFDTAPQILAALKNVPTRRSNSSISPEIPSFTVPRLHGSMSTQDGYIALVDAVDNKKGRPDTAQSSKSQVLVDGSDKPQSPSPVIKSGRPSTSNLLDDNERAELVRKNKKIVQVLGPGAVPAAQSQIRQATTGVVDPVNLRKEALHRSVRSESGSADDQKKDPQDQKSRDKSPHIERQSSWSALNHDTIFMTGTGRRHSSPLDSMSIHDPETMANWDAASMSSLGSIIEGGGILDRKNSLDRPRSPTSFMEMSDDDGMKTPKRRPSIDTTTSSKLETKSRLSYERIASPSLKISPPPEDNEARQSRHSIDSEETHISSIISRRAKKKDSIRSKANTQSYLSLSDDELDRHDGRWKGDPKSDTWRMDRQRKREKLAKIHRYLGSKVPAELVLGYSSSTSAPGLANTPTSQSHSPITSKPPTPHYPDVVIERPNDGTMARKKRRSSAAAMSRPWEASTGVTEHEVRKQDTLTESERLQEIKRAQKIQQIFGEKPPRRASLTRPATAPIQSHGGPSSPPRTPTQRSNSIGMDQSYTGPFSKRKKPKSPPSVRDGRPSTSGSSRPSTSRSTTGLIASYNKEVEREKKEKVLTGLAEDDINFSQTIQIPEAYFPPGTALGSPWEDLYDSDVLDISRQSMTIENGRAPIMDRGRTSRQFVDYRNSLNTLGRILDQDDRQSLNELHAVLDSDDDEEADIQRVDLHSLSVSRSTHRARDLAASDRRQRTLQPRASLSSINTVATSSTFQTLTPEPMAFQARRKRAAKLTHFFGATYRDLFGEVLDRIERGMLEEARHGEMSQEEIRHLMKELERLKRRQSQLS